MMRKTVVFASVLMGLTAALFQPFLSGQESAAADNPPQIKKNTTVYDPQNRRDPFKNLLGGTEAKSNPTAEGIGQLSVDEVVLTGIIKVRDRLIGIIRDPMGFPVYIREGDRFMDGYVVSIESLSVTLRKTEERGLPLLRPRDIIKELFEER